MFKRKQQEEIINLKKLLDGIETANKNEAKDYTSGHLNYKNLFKPQQVSERTFWKSVTKQNSLAPNHHQEHIFQSITDRKVMKMKDALADFTLKTHLTLTTPAKSSIHFSPLLKSPMTPINTPCAVSLHEIRSHETFMEKQELEKCMESLASEEIDLSQLKLLKVKREKNQTYQSDEYHFVPSYLTGLTKKDQFVIFSQFSKEYLKKEDLEKDFLKKSSIGHYERQLTKELLKIGHVTPPHVNRLQIFCEAFEDICNNSTIFGNILQHIKSAYESYIEHLLDARPSTQYEVFRSGSGGISKRAVKKEDVEAAVMTVRLLIQEAKGALNENEQLRNQLKEALKIYSTKDTVEKDLPVELEVEDSCEKCNSPSLVDLFELKRCEVLELCTTVQNMEQGIKKNMTHAVNTNAREQHIKEIQAEAVKLQSSNKFLMSASKDLDTEIKRALNKQKLTLEKQMELKSMIECFLTQD
ncbi:uncharacterized protein C6orf118 homolog [Bombina bombina]|uniref:uncharacterized protein C6orf118 homolog n=1 Tax=Bombina bombina TaxID=8345 RepID=UPI00235A751D|nr:uncharacterized protein C6orf118 homolog [Bombina bombina]